MGNFEFNKIHKGKVIIFTSALILAGFPTVISAEDDDIDDTVSITAENHGFSLNNVEGSDLWIDAIQQTDVSEFDLTNFIGLTNELYINFLNDNSSDISIEVFIRNLEKELSLANKEVLELIMNSLSENVEVDIVEDRYNASDEKYYVEINEELYQSFLNFIEENKDRLKEEVNKSTYTIEDLVISQSESDDTIEVDSEADEIDKTEEVVQPETEPEKTTSATVEDDISHEEEVSESLNEENELVEESEEKINLTDETSEKNDEPTKDDTINKETSAEDLDESKVDNQKLAEENSVSSSNIQSQSIMSISSTKNIKQELINDATSGGASSRWHAAVEGYAQYPEEHIFVEQLKFLSNRMLTFGMQEHDKGNYNGALIYYNRITEGPSEIFNSTLIQETKVYQNQAKNTQTLKTKENMIIDAISGGASSRWHASIEGYKYFPKEKVFIEQLNSLSDRMLEFGMKEHENSDYSDALIYYSRITKGPTNLFDSATVNDTKIYQSQAENNLALMTKQSLINDATSGGASSQWHASLNGYMYYPSEQLFKDQLKSLSNRMLSFGMQSHENRNFSAALVYYKRLSEGPAVLFSQELIKEAETYIKQASNNQRLISKNMLLTDARTGRASSRWHAAIEGQSLFPEVQAFSDEISYLSKRMIDLGMQAHRNNNFSAASVYYSRIINGPSDIISTDFKKEIAVYNNQAENEEKLITKDTVLNESSTGGASSRFNSAKLGYELFNGITSFEDVLRDNANRLIDLGVNHHDKGEFNNALIYYNKLADLDDNFSDILTKVRTNKYFAENKLYLVNSIYYSSNYNLSIDEMLKKQMSFDPQTDAYGNGWETAKSSDVKYYLDSTNFVGDIEVNTNNQQVRVTTNALNVRSNSSTSGNIIGSVSLNDVFDIVDSSNGWYAISYNNKIGWISGNFVSLISNPKEFTIEKLQARVNTSVLNVRQSASTNSSILSTVKQGDKLTVLLEKGEWLNIENNNTIGWVHRDYVIIESSINRDALQFLTLSGTSGIKVADLNRELTGKGILENLGESFVKASLKHNINEVYLLSHALLETGNGSSELATGIRVTEVDGKPVTPKVVYNMYGIGAFDKTAKKSGSEYAYKQGWDTPEKAIIGGAEWISRQYVNHPTYKQDTLYKMRWNPSSPGNHQYATDIGWAYKQTNSLQDIVEYSQRYNFVLRFDIPFFDL